MHASGRASEWAKPGAATDCQHGKTGRRRRGVPDGDVTGRRNQLPGLGGQVSCRVLWCNTVIFGVTIPAKAKSGGAELLSKTINTGGSPLHHHLLRTYIHIVDSNTYHKNDESSQDHSLGNLPTLGRRVIPSRQRILQDEAFVVVVVSSASKSRIQTETPPQVEFRTRLSQCTANRGKDHIGGFPPPAVKAALPFTRHKIRRRDTDSYTH